MSWKQIKDRVVQVLRPIAFAALLAGVVYAMVGQNRLLADGERAPELHLTSYDGKVWNLDQFEGRVTVVNFWATWCPPCMVELPEFARVSAAHEDDVVFVGVAVSSPSKDVFSTIRRLGIRYPIARPDPHALDDWKAETLPTTYVLDAQHRLVFSARGQLTGAELEAAIAEAKDASQTEASQTEASRKDP